MGQGKNGDRKESFISPEDVENEKNVITVDSAYNTVNDETANESSSEDVKVKMETEAETVDNGEEEGSEEEEEEEDPWNMVFKIKPKKIIPWDDLTTCQKVYRILVDKIFFSLLKLVLLLGLLYLFVCSLQIMSSAFQLLGGKAAGNVLESDILNNPIGGLMIGVMVTVLVQSSSTSTSIIVSMVGAGVLTVEQAIPFIMGANIGTSVTNTIVAVTQAKDRDQFRRAFGGATVHDMFNWLSVLILLPIETMFGLLYLMSEGFLSLFNVSPNDSVNVDFLNAITKPLTSHIVQIDKSVITDIALGSNTTESMLMRCEPGETGSHCNHMFAYSDLSDAAIGGILLMMSLVALTLCLICLVKLLHWMLQGPKAIKIVRKSVNADFPGKFSFLTGYVAMLVGAGITFLVQSSSVFTSAITPLVGMGLISIQRMYPLTLGSNIGTTGTSILAALAQPDNFLLALQVALCHLFFNILGIMIWYPIPFMRNVPITLAKNLGNNTAKYRWFAIVYLVSVFFLLPMSCLALSLASTVVFLSVGISVAVFFAVIVIINIMQAKAKRFLPKVLEDWKFLPAPLRSLKPYDKPFSAVGMCCHRNCAKCTCCKSMEDDDKLHDDTSMETFKRIDDESPQVVKYDDGNDNRDTTTKQSDIRFEITSDFENTDIKEDDAISIKSSDSGIVSGNISTISGQLSTSHSVTTLKAYDNFACDEGGS